MFICTAPPFTSTAHGSDLPRPVRRRRRHSRLPHGAAQDIFSAFVAMLAGASPGPAGEVPLIVLHGDRDRTIAPVNADRLIASRIAVARGVTGVGAARCEPATTHGGGNDGHRHSRRVYRDADGRVVAEQWAVHGGAHAWVGGSPRDLPRRARATDASGEMLRFFLEQPAAGTVRDPGCVSRRSLCRVSSAVPPAGKPPDPEVPHRH